PVPPSTLNPFSPSKTQDSTHRRRRGRSRRWQASPFLPQPSTGARGAPPPSTLNPQPSTRSWLRPVEDRLQRLLELLHRRRGRGRLVQHDLLVALRQRRLVLVQPEVLRVERGLRLLGDLGEHLVVGRALHELVRVEDVGPRAAGP